jgi:hypothetical protein
MGPPSILVALGVDPGSVMDQLGHTDPSFTLRVYRMQGFQVECTCLGSIRTRIYRAR